MSDIIRKQQVTVATVSTNRFGGLEFTDGAGTFYKISDKRVQYFKDTIIPGTSVQLNYAMSSFGKEFIFSADKMGQASVASVPPVVTPRPAPLAVAPTGNYATPKPTPPHIPLIVSGPEQGMWWKELGDMIRAEKVAYDLKDAYEEAYWKQMNRVLGLSNIPAEAVKPPVSVPTSSQSGKGREAEVDRRMLFSIIKTKLKFNTDNAALQWLLQVNKIPQERIDNEPDIVFTEMLVKYNWD